MCAVLVFEGFVEPKGPVKCTKQDAIVTRDCDRPESKDINS